MSRYPGALFFESQCRSELFVARIEWREIKGVELDNSRSHDSARCCNVANCCHCCRRHHFSTRSSTCHRSAVFRKFFYKHTSIDAIVTQLFGAISVACVSVHSCYTCRILSRR